MNIYYCDACGKRLSIEDSAKVVAGTPDKDILCPLCVSKPVAKPGSSPRNSIDVSEVAAPPPQHPVPGRRSTTGANVRPNMQRPASAIQPRVSTTSTRAPSGARNVVQAARSSAQGRAVAAPEPKKKTELIIGAVVAGVILLVVGVLLMGGGNKGGPKVSQPETTSKPKTTPEPATPPVSLKPPPSENTKAPPVVAPEPTKATPAPEKNDDPYAGLSPKEAYEKRLKEGKIKAPEPPPPMPEKLPEPDGTWKSLFNGKDLTGWQFWKGKWSVEDGVIVGRAEPVKGGSLIYENESFTDFDFACSVYLEGTRYCEVWARGGAALGMNYPQPEWRTIRISARGNQIKATVNGQPAQLQEVGASGQFSFFMSPEGVMKIKDVKVKAYSK
ncbi:MAG TPA: family 16 glycoside hydrolase [Planctomycetota bacterium]|nr:family 16 glycoside hydrolase [Planctomycetota bacterium]